MGRNNIFILLIGFSTLLFSCENSREEIEALTKHNVGIETAKDVTIIYSLGAQTKSRINAPLMIRHVETNPYIEFPEHIYAEFFDDSLTVESWLSANYAKYFENDSKVFLRDSVVVYNSQGDTLYCRELYWDRHQKGREFYTDKPIRIRTPTQLIDGIGLEAPQDFKSFHTNDAVGILRIPASEVQE